MRAVQSVQNRSLNMWTLIGLGVFVSYTYSVVATIAPDIFPESLKTDGVVPVYFEAASVIVTLTLLGQVLEENLRRVDTVVVDKTGTLTVGKPTVGQVDPASGETSDQVLRAAASVNQSSEHPLAKAITAAANEASVGLVEPEDFDAHPGFGVSAKIASQSIVVGIIDLFMTKALKPTPI